MLEIAGISKRFGALAALDDISLSVADGEIHCLLGENGAGKSTLCNVIFGVIRPDAGTMQLAGQAFNPSRPADSLRAGVGMVHQHFSVIETLTVLENMMLGHAGTRLPRVATARRIREISEEYDLSVESDRLVGTMSVGERQRVEIVKCLMLAPKLLVLDEPTAVLPPAEVDSLLAVCRKVTQRGCAVILVTHKLAEIREVADRVTVLRGGRAVTTARLAEADLGALVRAMVGRDVAALGTTTGAAHGVETAAEAAGMTRTGAAPTPIVAAEDALTLDAVSYVDEAGRRRLDEITIVIRRGEIVGLAGVEGNGQSELGAILAGLALPSAGRVFVDGKEITGRPPAVITAAGVGVVPEDRHAVGCIEALSVAENVCLSALGAFSRFGMLRRRQMAARAVDLMRSFDVRAAGPDAPMRSLSGGNQQKVVLARELSRDDLVFLLAAQPTRGLDVGAVAAVYDRIRTARAIGTGVLLISSELDELLSVADRILVIYRGRIIGERKADPAAREAIGALMSGHVPVAP
ncbi:ABC transporter ATP-binding protein [Acidiphilium sp.]|uniref:ABC transporter ATP-binding protein n=1 Tax=Acidiphilium sp. TaxID=527 RepID=UPI0025846431|nr:ABC transporter ATP-binding protein [Acidiphilium sp.]